MKFLTVKPEVRIRCWLWYLLLALMWPGPAMAQLSYADWRLQWAEEFDAPLDTAALGGRWRFYYPWGHALHGAESQYYTGRMLQVQDGMLRLRSQRLTLPLPYIGKKLRYASAMLFSRGPADTLRPTRCPDEGGFSYGLFEIRCRLGADNASWPAFWLFGGAPDEIDIFEGTPTYFSNNIHLNPNLYWRSTSRTSRECPCLYFSREKAELHRQFHTYAVSWLPGELVFYFDGVPIRRETAFTPLGCGMELIVNLAMLEWAQSARDSMEIDYIRVYRPAPEKVVTPWPQEEPVSDLQHIPRIMPPGAPDPTSRQHWAVRRTSSDKLELHLLENRNPPCDSRMLLPQRGHWQPAWVRSDESPLLELTLPPEAPLRWQVRRVHNGSLAGQGYMTADEPTPLRWLDTLAPGAYVVQLQLGEASCVQPLYVLAKEPEATP